MRVKPTFHPKAPRLLKRLWKEYPAYNQIAKHLKVNQGLVWKALTKGKEPMREDLRLAFGLSRKPRKKRQENGRKTPVPMPQYQKWWRGLDPIIKDMYIKETYENWKQ